MVEPVVKSAKEYFRDSMAVFGESEAKLAYAVAMELFVEVGMFVMPLLGQWYMIDFRLENLYVFDGGVAYLDFEYVLSREKTLLKRLGDAYTQMLNDAKHWLPQAGQATPGALDELFHDA